MKNSDAMFKSLFLSSVFTHGEAPLKCHSTSCSTD